MPNVGVHWQPVEESEVWCPVGEREIILAAEFSVEIRGFKCNNGRPEARGL